MKPFVLIVIVDNIWPHFLFSVLIISHFLSFSLFYILLKTPKT